MEPIAKFTETRIEGTRVFTLWEDRLAVKGASDMSEFETSFHLRNLEPHFDTVLKESPMQAVGWLVMGGGAVLMVMDFSHDPPATLLTWVGLTLFCFGVLVVALSLKKTKFVRFKNRYDQVVVTMAKAGFGRKGFDAFVEKVAKQIELIHSQE